MSPHRIAILIEGWEQLEAAWPLAEALCGRGHSVHLALASIHQPPDADDAGAGRDIPGLSIGYAPPPEADLVAYLRQLDLDAMLFPGPAAESSVATSIREACGRLGVLESDLEPGIEPIAQAERIEAQLSAPRSRARHANGAASVGAGLEEVSRILDAWAHDRAEARAGRQVTQAAEAALAEIDRWEGTLLLGPWLAEPDLELLLWIPFLRWLRKVKAIDKDRMVVVGRGGVQAWYGGLLGEFVDALELPGIELGAPPSGLEPEAPGERDAAIVAAAAARLGLGDYLALHPATIFPWLFADRRSDRQEVFLATHARYAPLRHRSKTVLKAFPDLPPRYIAVDFGATEAFPDTPAHRDFAGRVVRRLAQRIPVVRLAGPVDAGPGPNVHLIAEGSPASEDLGVRSAVAASAEAFVGSLGGLAYAALTHGKPTFAFHGGLVPPRPDLVALAEHRLLSLGGAFQVLRTVDIDYLAWRVGWILEASESEAQAPQGAAPSSRAEATSGLWDGVMAGPDWTPKVSILVLTLDGEALLERMLASFEQVNTYPNVEFVVVDHGSTDGTLALLDDWATRLPIRVIARGQNYSFSKSNNKAARFASGELLLLLNNDVVFTEDCLPAMVRTLGDETVGAVGLKLMSEAADGGGLRVQHAGVRFRWSLQERRLRPYHVKPKPIDRLLAERAATFPAVTAAALLCRREDYFAAGGLDEGYTYGLEDLDFCCTLRFQLGKTIVCRNDLSMTHDKSATRSRDEETRARLDRANRRLLQRRWGYALRREFIAARPTDDGSVAGRPFAVGIAAGSFKADLKAAWALSEALRRLYGWAVRRLPADQELNAAGLDLYVGHAGIEPAKLTNVEPHLVCVAYLRGKADPGTEGFDLVWPDAWGADDAEDAARQLHDLVTLRFSMVRVAIKPGADEASDQWPEALKEKLASAGYAVRIDAATDGGARSLADDVVIAGLGQPLSREQINILRWPTEAGAPPEEPPSSFHAVWPVADGGKALRRIIARLHAERSHGPQPEPMERPKAPARER